MRGLAIAATIVLVAGCTTNTRTTSSSADFRAAYTTKQLETCDISVKPGIVLSVGKRCQLDQLKSRCHVDDRCLASCIAQGAGKNIGGGCWHLCFAYRNEKWIEPDGWEDCEFVTSAESAG
jgi:hypothetical protein